MSFLKKLQKQPEHIRKLILWVIIVVIGLVLALFWFYSSVRKIREFQKEEFIENLNIPSFEKDLEVFPEIEPPEHLIKELEELEDLEKELEKAEKREQDIEKTEEE